MTGVFSTQLRVTVVLLGSEGGGIRRFLLTQLAHAEEVGITFEYVCLHDGPMAAELRARGANPSILSVPLPRMYPRSPLAGVVQWMLHPGGFEAAQSKLRSHLNELRPDIIYSHFLHTHLVCGRVGRLLRIPCVGQVHGTLNRRRALGLTRLGYSIVLSRSLDAIIMVSKTAAASLAPLAQPKARTIYSGIDADTIESSLHRSPRLGGRLVALGRIAPGKKLDVAIRALSIVAARGLVYELCIIGGPIDHSNAYYRKLQWLVRDLGLSGRVAFTGPLDPPYDHLAQAEALVNCSTVEGLSYVVMESMVCKTPVIVADVGAPSEIVENDASGLHFRADDPASLADAIIRLMADREFRGRLAESAYRYARQTFDIHTHMRNIRETFDDVRRRRPCPT